MKKKFRIYIYVILLLLAFLSLSIYFLSLFRIKKIIIISADPIMAGLDVFNGRNLLFLKQEKVIQELLKRNTFVKSISLVKRHPNTILLEVIVRKPEYIVSSNSRFFPIDKEGFILSGIKQYDDTLPKIEIFNLPFWQGTKTDWRILKAGNILNEIAKESILVDRIEIDDNAGIFNIYLPQGTQVIVPYNIDPLFLSPSLQVIISRFRIEGKFINKVDFRFDKPIVILSNGEKISSP